MKKPNPSTENLLRSTQAEFWKQLTARDLSSSEGDLLFLSSAKENFEIYRYAYRTRISESLLEDYPHLSELVGESRFQSFLNLFFEQGGSTQFSLVDTAWDFYKTLNRSVELSDHERFCLDLDFEALALFYADAKDEGPAPTNNERDISSQKWTLSDRCRLMDFAPKSQFNILYKNKNGFVECLSVSDVEFQFLKGFSKAPRTLEECAEFVLSEEQFKSSLSNWITEVPKWFAIWSQELILKSIDNS